MTDPKPVDMDMLLHSIETFVKLAPEIARVRRAHYDASLREGFTPAEALVLCQKVTL